MKNLFLLLLMTIVTAVSAQNIGFDPRIEFKSDNGYNPNFIRNPVLQGDRIGRTVFSGWLSPQEKWFNSAEIKAVVTGQPGPGYLPSDLVFSTGANALQECFRIRYDGDCGINNPTPGARLSVLDVGTSDKAIFEAIGGLATNNGKKFRISTATSGLLNAQLQGSMQVESGDLVVTNGKMGIGLEPNDLPGNHKLYVNGSAVCTELLVDLKSNWPDYVFGDEYRLMPLSELETYLCENEHLPNVPSAAQIAQNGLSVGEMQRITMEKIEELTLYILQQRKEIETLKAALQEK